jgi:hypothetical protein
MLRLATLGLCCLGLLACQMETVQEKQAASVSTASLPLPERWEGIIWTRYDPQTLQAAAPESLIIRDEAAYQALIERIPRYQIGKSEPVPPSKDPLLRRPPLDFTREMLLVAIRGDSMYVPPRIENIESSAQTLRISVSYPPLGDAAYHAQPLEIGSYSAWRVPRNDLPVEWGH